MSRSKKPNIQMVVVNTEVTTVDSESVHVDTNQPGWEEKAIEMAEKVIRNRHAEIIGMNSEVGERY